MRGGFEPCGIDGLPATQHEDNMCTCVWHKLTPHMGLSIDKVVVNLSTSHLKHLCCTTTQEAFMTARGQFFVIGQESLHLIMQDKLGCNLHQQTEIR